MIEQEKNSCTGYLRSGKILQLMGKPDTAMDVYQLGLRRVSPGDPNTKLLKGLSDRLAGLCAPAKAMDPFQVLPIEIVDIVISFMTFDQIVHMLRVSKSWRDLLSSMPRLWADLDFSNSRKNVSITAVRRYVRNARGTCSAVQIDRLAPLQQNILGYVVSRCRGLRSIRISSGFIGASLLRAVLYAINLQVLIVSSQCEITYDTVSQLLDQCVNLGQAEFHEIKASGLYSQKHAMSKMHTLLMNVARGGRGVLSFSNLLTQSAKIRSLTLRNWEDHDRFRQPLDFSCLLLLESLDIDHVVTGLPPKVPKSLRSINMTGCNAAILGPGPDLQLSEPPVLPDLSSILVGYSTLHATPHVVDFFKASTGGIQVADLSGKSFENEVIGLILDGYMARVEKLMLRESAVDDDGVSLIAQKLPLIKQLDLARTNVSGVGVRTLITGLGGKLEWLGLDECARTSVDAVVLARSMGVRVSYSFPDPRGSKKIRHQY